MYRVFRDRAGRLTISSDAPRFRESSTSGHASFEARCPGIRRITTATMIADPEQRMLELAMGRQPYRVRASDSTVRDSIPTMLGRACGAL